MSFVLLMVFIAVPMPYTATEEYTEPQPYTKTEYSTQQVPYETTEDYPDTEQYTVEECDDIALTKNVKWGTEHKSCIDEECTSYNQVCIETNWLGNCLEYEDVCQSTTCTRYRIYCSLTIKNLDDQAGVFGFDGYYVTKDGEEHFSEAFSRFLQPDDEKSFTWRYVVDLEDRGQCTYKNLMTPTKKDCDIVIKTRNVVKTRPVTGYKEKRVSKQVIKYNEITKTRTVTRHATLFRQVTGGVEWYYKV